MIAQYSYPGTHATAGEHLGIKMNHKKENGIENVEILNTFFFIYYEAFGKIAMQLASHISMT